jgi:hypothetical protein
MFWHDEATVRPASSALLWPRQNPRADGHGRHLAEPSQGRKQDNLKQTNAPAETSAAQQTCTKYSKISKYQLHAEVFQRYSCLQSPSQQPSCSGYETMSLEPKPFCFSSLLLVSLIGARSNNQLPVCANCFRIKAVPKRLQHSFGPDVRSSLI